MSVNKLVRDKIPEIIEASGRKADYKILSDDEYFLELKKKLKEEVCEFFDGEEIEELADILEVVYAIAVSKGCTITELENIRLKKERDRGAFLKKIFLVKNY